MANIPKYQIVINQIKEQIENKKLLPGDRLKSEHEMCSDFKVSRQTVRHALGILEHEGIIEGHQGSGNYVSNVDVYKKHSSDSILIVTTYLNGYIFPKIIAGMERVLSENGYGVQIAFTHNDVEKERAVLQRILKEKHIAGLIIEPAKSGLPTPNIDIYGEIIKQRIPTVLFNSYYPQLDFPYVSMDDVNAGYKATSYLLEAGHTIIAGIFKSDDGQGHRRYQGYVRALVDAGIKVYEEHILWVDTKDLETMLKDEKRYLRRLKDCTACVCYNDELAYSLELICMKNKIAIPDQLSLVSIDNSEQAELCEVPVASVIHPMGKLGEKVAQNLVNLIDDDTFDAKYEFVTDIYVRDSVKRINK